MGADHSGGKTGQHADGSSLTRPIGAQEAKNFTRMHLKSDVVYR